MTKMCSFYYLYFVV